MRISVVMSVYNNERYVAEAVESVLAQTLRDFEFIIIDDGSTDGSLAVLRRYADRDDRIRLVSRPNTGLIVALNEGIRMAHGEYMARMDGDDVCEPNRFEEQVRYLDQHPQCVALGSEVLVIDPEDLPITTRGRIYEHGDIEKAQLKMEGQMLYHPAMMFRLNVLNQLGGYRLGYDHAEDLDLFFRLMEVGKVENLPMTLLRYREHLGKVGATHIHEQMATVLRIVNEARSCRGMEPIEARYSENDGRLSESARVRNWGWWALAAGHRRTAVKYAVRSLMHKPISLESWRLCFCTLRGR